MSAPPITYTWAPTRSAGLHRATAADATLPELVTVLRPKAGGTIDLVFSTTPDASQLQTLGALVSAQELVSAKWERNAAIDRRTRSLIGAGFTHLGILFSSSQAAQRTIVGYHDARNAINWIQSPVTHMSRDDTQSITLDSAGDVDALYDDMIAPIAAHRSSGAQLKNQVAAATSLAGVAAVVDNR